ncbi:MAG: putative lipid II flippase FtsW [Desulfobacteraceae bacterium 4572_88]|nr:MAG: putative lipid II flippase FtsW [Desulfobacteraceae bacterium 4572_88]
MNLHKIPDSSLQGTPPDPGPKYDIQLLFPVLTLVGVGIIMVYSASSALAIKKFGTGYYFLKRQAIFAMIGLVALVVCRHFPLKLLHALTYPLLLISFVLLAAVVSGAGYSVGGATRWLRFGDFSFQPSEFTRFALLVYLAYSMSKKQDRLHVFTIGFVPHVVVLGLFILLILLQPDFGSAVILGAVTWIMMFVGGVRLTYLLSSLLVLTPVAYFFLVSAEYRLQRLISFWDPWAYATEGGYQIVHSLMAFGTGGFWGAGLGNGYQKLFYLPEPHTDFIFSVIGEELGFFGVLVILGLYSLILIRGIRIAMGAQDPFASFLAMGLTAALGLQVCVNMGVALALLPTKGLTLPFLSYGGTSLLLNMASIGVLMNIREKQNASAENEEWKPKGRRQVTTR